MRFSRILAFALCLILAGSAFVACTPQVEVPGTQQGENTSKKTRPTTTRRTRKTTKGENGNNGGNESGGNDNGGNDSGGDAQGDTTSSESITKVPARPTTQNGNQNDSAANGTTTKKTTQKSSTTTKKPTTTVLLKDFGNSVQTWFTDPLTDTFAHTKKPSGASASGAVHLAKNESESINVALRSTKDLTDARITVKPFSGSNAPKITVMPIRMVYTSGFSYGFTGQYAGIKSTIKRGDFAYTNQGADFPEYYDTIDNSIGSYAGLFRYSVFADESCSACVEVTTTKNTAPGTYKTSVIIQSEEGARELPITVTVYNVTLPDPKDSTFSYTNWFATANTYTAGFPGYMNAQYDITDMDDTFFNVCANYAKVMKKQRQNVIFVPVQALLAWDSTVSSNGTINFNWTSFDRYIETFIKNGSVKYLEGSFFYDKDWYIDPPGPNEWPHGDLACSILTSKTDTSSTVCKWETANAKANTKWVKCTSSEAKKYFDQLIPDLYNHLKAKGWEDMWLQHVADEPLSDLQTSQIKTMYERIRREMPGVKTTDAGSHQSTRFTSSQMSIYCPQLDDYENNRGAYNNIHKTTSSEVWTYTCVNPQAGDYMTRLGDYPLISTRVIGWYDWQQGVTGYLHWGWNLWSHARGGDPFVDMYCSDTVSDAFLVYPDSVNASVYEGVRSSAVRDSWEDYELLRLAAAKNNSTVTSKISTLVKKGSGKNNFVRDSKTLLDARIEMLKLASK